MSQGSTSQTSHTLTVDGWLLFTTRAFRLFAYGLLSVVLVLYLVEVGLNDGQIGLLLTLTMLGDTVISLGLTMTADRLGRRRMLLAGGLLMVFAAVLFAGTENFWLLLVAATIGVISPSGNEVGPFLPIEQAAISQSVPDDRRTDVFAWYNLVGSLATALGALGGGLLTQFQQHAGFVGASAYRPLLIVYGVVGLVLVTLFALLSSAVEIRPTVPPSSHPAASKSVFGLHRSRRVVLRYLIIFYFVLQYNY